MGERPPFPQCRKAALLGLSGRDCTSLERAGQTAPGILRLQGTVPSFAACENPLKTRLAFPYSGHQEKE
jgi:hypothetical protein